MDPTLGQRPQPPDINGHAWANGSGPRGHGPPNGGPYPGNGQMYPANNGQGPYPASGPYPPNGPGPYPGQGGPYHGPPAGHVDRSAVRVRQWIETRTVSDVRKVRPFLNQEIQRGFSLKKTNEVSDRSKPRF